MSGTYLLKIIFHTSLYKKRSPALHVGSSTGRTYVKRVSRCPRDRKERHFVFKISHVLIP